MSKFEVELNTEGVRELLQSEEMKTVLLGFAKKLSESKGIGTPYTGELSAYKGRRRWNVSIETAKDPRKTRGGKRQSR